MTRTPTRITASATNNCDKWFMFSLLRDIKKLLNMYKMSTLGELINLGYDFQIDKHYKDFADYFENPYLFKIKDEMQRNEVISMYGTKIHTLLGDENRYLFVFVKQDNKPLFTKERLSNLKWISLLTRMTRDEYDLPIHMYVPRRLPSLDKKIFLKKVAGAYQYDVSGLPIQITLLPKTKGGVDWNTTGTIVTALETYHTIITWKNQS
jgi:hypothetical protein